MPTNKRIRYTNTHTIDSTVEMYYSFLYNTHAGLFIDKCYSYTFCLKQAHYDYNALVDIYNIIESSVSKEHLRLLIQYKKQAKFMLDQIINYKD